MSCKVLNMKIATGQDAGSISMEQDAGSKHATRDQQVIGFRKLRLDYLAFKDSLLGACVYSSLDPFKSDEAITIDSLP